MLSFLRFARSIHLLGFLLWPADAVLAFVSSGDLRGPFVRGSGAYNTAGAGEDFEWGLGGWKIHHQDTGRFAVTDQWSAGGEFAVRTQTNVSGHQGPGYSISQLRALPPDRTYVLSFFYNASQLSTDSRIGSAFYVDFNGNRSWEPRLDAIVGAPGDRFAWTTFTAPSLPDEYPFATFPIDRRVVRDGDIVAGETAYIDEIAITPIELFALPTLAPAGDYNRDGVVDAADYSTWRDTLYSTTDLDADGDQDDVVGQGDYDVWRENFGLALGMGAAFPGSVPEPSSLVLSLASSVVAAIVCRYRRQ